MIVIQQMTVADLEAVLALRRQWLRQELEGADGGDKADSWIRAYPDNDQAFGLVANISDECVGYVLTAWLSHPTMTGYAAEIDEIHVKPGFRRQGVGRKLVESVRQNLRTRVTELTIIRARLDRRDVAGREFWQSLGFENWVLEFTDYLE